MVDIAQVGSAVAIIIVFVIAAVIKSWKGGYLASLRSELKRQRRKHTVNGKLDSISDKLDATYRTSKNNGEKIDDIGEVIYQLHRHDENVDEEILRDRVGVEAQPDDIFEGDQRDRGYD